MNLAGAGLQGITVSPRYPQPYSSIYRFIFGVNGELRNNLFLLEDHRLMYSAGHNIVVYNFEDKTQLFLSGIQTLPTNHCRSGRHRGNHKHSGITRQEVPSCMREVRSSYMDSVRYTDAEEKEIVKGQRRSLH